MANWQELVVAEFRKYRHLYDSALKDYRDQNMVNNSWREIAFTLGKSEDAVKKCWKNLRDRYVKARKGAKGKSGDPGGSKTPPILKEIGWLSSFIKHRATETNVTSCMVEEEQTEAALLQPSPTPCPVPTSPMPSPSTSSNSSEFSIGPSPIQNTCSTVENASCSPASSGDILAQYGWYLLAATITVYLLIQCLRKRISIRPSDPVLHSQHDASIVAWRQESMEAARKKMQEELEAKAAIFREKQKKQEEEKRRRKTEVWKGIQQGKSCRRNANITDSTEEAGSSSSTAQKPRTDKKKLCNNDYSPLMGQGGGSCSWRPGRRRPSAGG